MTNPQAILKSLEAQYLYALYVYNEMKYKPPPIAALKLLIAELQGVNNDKK